MVIQLRYTFPKYMLLQEPLLVVTAFYLLFVLVIIYVRLDFAISKVHLNIVSLQSAKYKWIFTARSSYASAILGS